MGFKLIQDSGLQIPKTAGGRNFTVSSHVLSRQIVHNTVGSLPLAKNALHSPTSYYNRLIVAHNWNETQYTHILHDPHDTQLVSMVTTNNRQPQAVSFKITSSLSNFPTMVHMAIKLCVYVYFIVSMTTVNKK